MRHDETRDNTTAIENQSIEADAHADTHVDPRVGIEGSDPTGRETFGERMLRLGEADAPANSRPHDSWRERKLRQAEAMFGKVGSSRMSKAMENRVAANEPDPAGVQLERRFGELPEVARKRIAREHDEIVAKARQESEERNGYDPEDPEHDPIGDAETEYDIEYDAEPEDDGQPSEYEEWQDYFGGDEYYDHSENEIW